MRLTNENEAEIRVPFLVTKENIEQPIIGFNVIELMVRNTESKEDDVLLGRMSRSFKTSKSGDIARYVLLTLKNFVCLNLQRSHTLLLQRRLFTYLVGPMLDQSTIRRLSFLSQMSWLLGLQDWQCMNPLPP